MQTFLPYPNFEQSAIVLDPKRLGNQFYREGLILMRGGWKNHPASKMWKGYEYYLCMYLLDCGRELQKRGRDYPHHMKEIREFMHSLSYTEMPFWLGDERLHSSHRANLLRKNYEHYSKFGWKEQPSDKYFWPV
jgi:hypothetical protein